MVKQDLKEKTLDAVNGYGRVVGLPNSESGEIGGSLPRIQDLLELLAETDEPLGHQARATLSAIRARESINGTPHEEADPENFERLTDAVRSQLDDFRQTLLSGYADTE